MELSLDYLTASAQALLRQIVCIPSLSHQEEQVSKFISATLSAWGIEHNLCRNNIVAINRRYDPAKPTIAIDAHMDTVAAVPSYTRDPYDPGDDPETVYGLGSNDDGGCLVSVISTFRYFYDRELPVNLVMVLSTEEETSSPDGAEYVYGPDGPFAKGLFRGADPEWVIICEPTQMRCATTERGLLVIDAEAHGVSGHAARNEGVNALYIALEDIGRLRSYEFSRISPKTGKVKMTVTQINAGTAHNVVPDSCRFVIDIRPTEAYRVREIVEELRGFCRSDLVPRSLQHESSATYEGSPLLGVVDALGIETFSSPTTSNWMISRRESIKMGPGDSARSHKADEYVKVSEIRSGIQGYINFIEKFNGNALE